MRYQIARNGEQYGPYTLEDIRRYLASGNIQVSDMVRSEEMPEWQSVAQLLGTGGRAAESSGAGAGFGAGHAAGQAAGDAYGGMAIATPDPPKLNWILLLFLGLVTLGVFTIMYEIVQAVWVKKVEPGTKALLYYMLFLLCWGLNFVGAASRMMMLAHGVHAQQTLAARVFSVLTSLGVVAFVIAYRFAMRNSLERHFNRVDPIGLRLGAVMTLLFGGLYFQYHFNRINAVKQALRYRGMGV